MFKQLLGFQVIRSCKVFSVLMCLFQLLSCVDWKAQNEVADFKKIKFIIYTCTSTSLKTMLDKISLEYLFPLKLSFYTILLTADLNQFHQRHHLIFLSHPVFCVMCVLWVVLFLFSFRWLCPGGLFPVSDCSAGLRVTMGPSCGWGRESRWSPQLICQNHPSNGAGKVWVSFCTRGKTLQLSSVSHLRTKAKYLMSNWLFRGLIQS